MKKGVASLKVSCPAGTAGCKGSLTLTTSKSFKLGRVKAQLALGHASFSLTAGQTKTVKVKLASGAARLASHRKLAVRVVETGAKVTLKF